MQFCLYFDPCSLSEFFYIVRSPFYRSPTYFAWALISQVPKQNVQNLRAQIERALGGHFVPAPEIPEGALLKVCILVSLIAYVWIVRRGWCSYPIRNQGGFTSVDGRKKQKVLCFGHASLGYWRYKCRKHLWLSPCAFAKCSIILAAIAVLWHFMDHMCPILATAHKF